MTRTREHEHYTYSATGQMIWSLKDECVVCGVGKEWERW